MSVSLVTSLAIIPFLLRTVSVAQWGGFVLGQTVGSIAGIGIGYGWAVFAPVQIALMDRQSIGNYISDSLKARLVLLLLISPFAVALIVLLSPARSDVWVNVLGATNIMVAATGASWLFLGTNRLDLLFLFDALPRLLGTFVAAFLLAAFGSFRSFALAQCLFTLLGLAATYRHIHAAYPGHYPRFTLRTFQSSLQRQSHGLLTAAVSAVYLHLPVLVVSHLFGAQLPEYALADRLNKFVSLATLPFVQLLQMYVPGAKNNAEMHRRARRAIAVAGLVGTSIGAIVWLLLPGVTDIVSGGRLQITVGLSIPMGATTALALMASVCGLACLSALELERVVVWSAVAGATVFATCVLPLAFAFGTPGIAWSAALSEATVLAIQTRALLASPRTSTGASTCQIQDQ